MLALFTSVIQLVIEFHQQRSDLDIQLERVNTFLPSLASAVWEFNENQITLTINALASLPNIDKVVITTASGKDIWATSDGGGSARVVSRTYPLIHRNQQIATIEMIAGLDGIFHRVLSLAIAVLLSNAITAFLVGGFVLLIVRAAVTNRIERLATKITALLPRLNLDVSQGSSATCENEIEALEYGFDTMAPQLQAAIAELRRSEDKFSRIFLSCPVNILITRLDDGLLLDVNDSFIATFGWEYDEVIGRSVVEIGLWLSLEARQALVMLVRENHGYRNYDTVMFDKSRHPRTVSLTSEIIEIEGEEYVINQIDDLTELKSAQAATRAMRDLDRIFRGVNIGITYLQDGKILHANKAFLEMFGYEESAVIGRGTRVYYTSDEDYAALEDALMALARGQSGGATEVPMRRSDGADMLCAHKGSLVDPGDPSKGSIWTYQDITAERVAEKQLARTLDQVATLLNNSGQGFLSFGSNLRIDEGFSRECTSIFGRDLLGLRVPELLCPDDPQQRDLVERALQLILHCADDPLRRDAYIELLPVEYRLGDCTCKVEYRLLDDDHMMLILTDITDERQLRERLALERTRLEFIVNALEGRDELLEILREFDDFRSRALPDLLSAHHQPQAVLAEVFRQIHTFKSLLAQASLPTIPDVLHDLESRLGHLRERGEDIDATDIKRELGACDVGAALDKDLTLLRDKLGQSYFSPEREIRVPASKLDSLEAEACALYGGDSSILQSIRRLRYVPLEDLIAPHFKAGEQLAERQEKLLAPIVYTGYLASVDPDVYGGFCKSLIHLFRNAVDHGIEDPDTRLMADKDETATIRCTVRAAGDHLTLTIEDDGRGIDPAVILAKALEMGTAAATLAAMSDAETLLLIFAEGLTTRDEVSAISGRGVGLSAVMQELTRLGGTVRVQSVIGQGARFDFTLPYHPVAVTEGGAVHRQADTFLAPLPELVRNFCDSHIKLPVTLDPTLRDATADGLLDFTTLVSLGKGVEAGIGISIERPLLLEMTQRFDPDFPEDDIKDLADSVGGEILNTLVGNATVYFTHLSHRVTMGTPEIIAPEDRAARIGSHAFRSFTGQCEAGRFIVFCLLAE
jgi:PAS domain S-box-containing protein